MFWIVLIIVVGIIAAMLDSAVGKIVLGCSVAAIGLLLLKLITGIAILVTLAKVCAVIIVVTVAGALLLAIFG